MFAWCYLGLIGCLFAGIIYCQDSNPLSMNVGQQNEPDVEVHLSVDTQPKSSSAFNEETATATDSTTTQTPEPFACYECTNCHLTSNMTSQLCESGINMCYAIHKRIDNTSRIISRGCSTLKGQCNVPNDDQSNLFDSVTCCTSHKCNQAIHFKPLFFLPILSLFVIIYI